MIIDAGQVAVLIGIANGVILLLKPIARLHQRIDRNERELWDVKGRVAKLEDVKNDVHPD